MLDTEQKKDKREYSLDQNDYFVRRTAGKFMINSIVSMLFIYIAQLIDTLLVGMFIGEEGLAAMSLVSPMYLIYYTVGATIGIGSSVYSSRVLGKGDIEEYRKAFTSATVMLTAAAVVMTLIGYTCIDGIMKILCGSVTGTRADLAKDYLLYYFPGGAFTLIAYIPLYYLRIEGKPKLASRFFTMSGIFNMIFSYLFMSPIFNMGISGASLATSMSFLIVAVAGFIVMLKGKTELRFVKNSFSKERSKAIIVAGAPTGLSNILESSRILLLNMLIINLGAAMYLTCYTVVRNVTDIITSVILGIATAIIPLIGVFYGERNYTDERAVMKRTLKLGTIVVSIITLIVCLIPIPICKLFGVSDPEIMAEIKWAIPLGCFGLVAAYVTQQYICYLTTINKEGLATVLVALYVFVMVAVIAVPMAYAVGIRGIWLSMSLANIATLIIFCIIRAAIQKKNPAIDHFLLDTSLEQDGDISFAVKNDVKEIVNASEKISLFCEDNDIDMKKTMKISLAIEEILTFLLTHCLGEDKENYVAVRVCKIDDDVMMRFRYIGEIYDPMDYYKLNADNEELSEELLGLKMVTKSAKKVDFQQTLGSNNLIITF